MSQFLFYQMVWPIKLYSPIQHKTAWYFIQGYNNKAVWKHVDKTDLHFLVSHDHRADCHGRKHEETRAAKGANLENRRVSLQKFSK